MKLKKGSPEAKKFMAKIRAKKKSTKKAPTKKALVKKAKVKKAPVKKLSGIKQSNKLKKDLKAKKIRLVHGYETVKRKLSGLSGLKNNIISGVNNNNLNEIKNTKFLIEMYQGDLMSLLKNPKQYPFNTLSKKWYNDTIKSLKNNIAQKKRQLTQLKKLI